MRKSGTFTLLTALVLFFTDSMLLGAIFLFVLRNKNKIDIDKYVEERRSATYGGNPYNRNTYGGNPYNRNTYNGTTTNSNKTASDPFEEFSGKESNSSNTTNSGDNGGNFDDSDDLFN